MAFYLRLLLERGEKVRKSHNKLAFDFLLTYNIAYDTLTRKEAGSVKHASIIHI